jgi:hypothetical protein
MPMDRTDLTPPPSAGWDESPQVGLVNQQAAQDHAEEYFPHVQNLIKSVLPTATPQDRMAAGESMKALQNSNEARIGDVLGALVNLDPKALYVAATGGSDIKEEAYNKAGQRYFKVYNQRDELRRYEDGKGNALSDKDMESIGPLTSRRDITAERLPAWVAAGQTFKDVAAAQAANWNKTIKTGAAALTNSGVIKDASVDNQSILPDLYKVSLDPNVRAILSGASTISTGNQKDVSTANQTANKMENGTATGSDLSNLVNSAVGVQLGLKYSEEKGLTNSKNEKVSSSEIKSAANSYATSQSSKDAINARQTDLLAKAQLLKAANIPNIDKIQRFINNNHQIALAQKDIEDNGGIGIAKPNLPYSQGDSFTLAHVKAINDEQYADLANKYGQTVIKQSQSLPPGTTPPIGTIEAQLSIDPEVINRKLKARQTMKDVVANTEAQMNAIPTQDITTVSPALSTAGGVAPPVVTAAPAGKPTVAKSKPPAPVSDKKKILNSIFGG